MMTKRIFRLAVLLISAWLLPLSVSISVAQVVEGAGLNGNSASKGKAVGAEKKQEGQAATSAGNKLSGITEEMEGGGNAKAPDFNVKDLDELGKRRTAGWLRTADGKGGWNKTKVGSPSVKGATRPKSDWYNKVAEMFGGENKNLQKAAAEVAKHAEGQAAGLMRERGIQKAWLDINNNYVCPECRTALSRMLPRGSELIVRYWDDTIRAMKELPPIFGL